MKNYDAIIVNFLAQNKLENAAREPLAGDASNRRYERIRAGDETYMLMVAPPDKEDVKPFINVDQILRSFGLNAPKIHDNDVENGLLLLEDFGDDLYSKVLQINPTIEKELYRAAIEVLENLPDDCDVPEYSTQKLLDEAALFADWFATGADREEYLDIWRGILAKLDNSEKVIVLRDYHADNLVWLPEREGLRKVGLLDFQDALFGHRAYDYVSLLEDARRDVSPEIVCGILEGKSEGFMRDYYILGAQRNCKIIGIFNRLKKRDGKDGYLKFLPRVWNHLRGDLEHPALAPMKVWIEKNVSKEVAA